MSATPTGTPPDEKQPSITLNLACLLLPVVVFVLLNPDRSSGEVGSFGEPLIIACLICLTLFSDASRRIKQAGWSAFIGVLLVFAYDAVNIGIHVWTSPYWRAQ